MAGSADRSRGRASSRGSPAGPPPPRDQDLDLAIAGEAGDVAQWCCRHRLAHGDHGHRHALDARLAQSAGHRRGAAPGEVQIVAIPSALIGMTDDPGRLPPAPWQASPGTLRGREPRRPTGRPGRSRSGPHAHTLRRPDEAAAAAGSAAAQAARRRPTPRGAKPWQLPQLAGRAEVTGHRWLLNPT